MLDVKCSNHIEFANTLEGIQVLLEKPNDKITDTLAKIAEFIENNKDHFIQEKIGAAAILLNSLGTKVRHAAPEHPLLGKLKNYVKQILPSDPQATRSSLLFLRCTIREPTKSLKAIADWIDLVKIPLAILNLSKKEFHYLLTNLEYIDFTNYNLESLESIDLELITESLKREIKFRNLEIVSLAKLCVEKCGWHTAVNFRNFRIEEERDRIEIAKLCFLQNFNDTIEYIDNFEIREAGRTEIALLCAEICSDLTVLIVHKFKIEDEKARFEIAKLCAQRDGRFTARYIQNFKIGEAGRIEVARLCAQQDPSWTAKFIQKLEIKNSQALYQLFSICLREWPDTILHINNFSPLPLELQKYAQIISVLHTNEPQDTARKQFFEHLNLSIKAIPVAEGYRDLISEMSKMAQSLEPHAQNMTAPWLLSSILLLKETKSEAAAWMLGQKIWTELGLLHDPILRTLLSAGLYALGSDEDARQFWEPFLSSVRGMEGQRALMLMAIPFYGLQKQGIDKHKLFQAAAHLAELQKQKSTSLRSVHYIKNLLHTFHSISSHKTFTPEQKSSGFEKIFFTTSSIFCTESQILKNAMAAKGLLQIYDPNWPTSLEDLGVRLRISFERVIHIPLAEINGDLLGEYDNKFGACRNPCALLTYAAALKTLQEEAVMNCLGQYVTSVLNGTFQDQRYATTHNPHLAKVIENRPALLAKWKENIEVDLETMTHADKSRETIHPEEWLRKKLVIDKHLGEAKLGYLFQYLEASSEEKRTAAYINLLDQIKQSMKRHEKLLLRIELDKGKTKIKKLEEELKHLRLQEKDPVVMQAADKLGQSKHQLEISNASLKAQLDHITSSTAKDPALANLNFQKACISLIKAGQDAETNSLIKLLEGVEKAIHHKTETGMLYADSEFAKDVNGLLEGLKKQKSAASTENLMVIFTDDPIDLLLCGTEVSGSCQRVDGYPNANKGLLGYLMDGKIRLLAIKERDIIIARCLLNLLWAGDQPVLYRERFYPDQISPHNKTALNNLAKQVAQKLAVPLTCRDEGPSYNKDLLALGGPAPYEYSDGAGGIQKEGRYKIQNARQMPSTW